MDYKVSVVIPVFNRRDIIEKSLNSVLNQTYKNFEVIIVDDGSTDNLQDKINEYIIRFENVKYIYQENLGVSSARNKGIEHSRGGYICFLDSDDFLDQYYLEKMVSKISYDNADICYCGQKLVTETGIKRAFTSFTNANLIHKHLLNKVDIQTGCWLIKKELLKTFDIKFPVGLSWGEDIEFFTAVLSKAKRSTYVSDYLVNVLKDDSKVPNRLSIFQISKLDDDYDSVQSMLENKNITDLKSKNIIKDYRLQSLLIYRLYESFNHEVNNELILSYYNKYKNNFEKNSLINGVRSLKLLLYKSILKRKIRKIRKINR